MEQIELTGSAVTGIPVGGQHHMATVVPQLPTRVCLGRNRPKAMPACLKMSSYFSDADLATTPMPISINRRDKAATSLSRAYKNDALGCCVISGKGHLFGVLSANDSDSGGIVLMTDAEVVEQYRGICGPGDNGCNISNVLDVCRSKGFKMNGKMYKIDGYLSADWTNKNIVKAVQLIFGASTIGFDLPEEWLNTAVWKPTNSRIKGGHDVTPIDYDEQGIYVSSWGRVYLMVWDAFLSRKWISEYYAILAPLWYNSDMLAPNGLKVDELRADLTKIGNGVLPDIGPEPPPLNPVRPNMIRIETPIPAGFKGTVTAGSAMDVGDYFTSGPSDPNPPPIVPPIN